MKRIAIFCDGTWNSTRAARPTHVVRLAQAVRHTARDGRKQVVHYVTGIGTAPGSNAWDRFAGGALGWGLADNIRQAYEALVFSYEPGDWLYVFGFSRGAYTARSLVGLIRSVGICPRDRVAGIPEAFDRYRRRGDPDTHPASAESRAFRARFAPDTATSDEEWAEREAVAPGRAVNLKVAYLGLWDTVGALGVPGTLFAAPILNRRHRFHDTDLSRMVATARHAVAIDERRRTYPPTLWSNVDDLNRTALGLPDGADLGEVDRARLPYREEWFPGDHSTVGGGGPAPPGLSAYACAWIAEGAVAAGLDLAPGFMEALAAEQLAKGALGEPPASLADALLRLRPRDRAAPAAERFVAPVAWTRWDEDGGYRPRPLAGFRASP